MTPICLSKEDANTKQGFEKKGSMQTTACDDINNDE